MRPAIYILLAAVVQTVLLPRLNIFGVMPDLFLVTVIILALQKNRTAVTLSSAGLGLLTDLLSAGFFSNTIAYVIAGNIAKTIKEDFFGDEKSLAVRLVLGLSAGLVLLTGAGHFFLLRREWSLSYLSFRLVAFPLYNLLAWLIIAPLAQQAFYGD